MSLARFRTLALATAIAALATPAVAMAAPKVGFAGLGAEWALPAIDRPNPGPFAPLVGKPDYGTAENAFGASRSGHMHEGQDIFGAPGTPEVAPVDAVVDETGSDGGQGNYVYLYDRKRDRTYV